MKARLSDAYKRRAVCQLKSYKRTVHISMRIQTLTIYILDFLYQAIPPLSYCPSIVGPLQMPNLKQTQKKSASGLPIAMFPPRPVDPPAATAQPVPSTSTVPDVLPPAKYECPRCKSGYAIRSSLIRHLAARHEIGLDGQPLSAAQIAAAQKSAAHSAHRRSTAPSTFTSEAQMAAAAAAEAAAAAAAVAAATAASIAPTPSAAIVRQPSPADRSSSSSPSRRSTRNQPLIDLSADLQLSPSVVDSRGSTPVRDELDVLLDAAATASVAPAATDVPVAAVAPAAATKKRAATSPAAATQSKQRKLAAKMTRAARTRLRVAGSLLPQPVRPIDATAGRRRTNPSAVYNPPPRPAIGTPPTIDLRSLTRSSAATLPPASINMPPSSSASTAAVSSVPAAAAQPPTRRRLPYAALHFATMLRPTETAEDIAAHLADDHGWDDGERQEAAERIHDIQRSIWTQTVLNHGALPALRTTETVNAYFAAMDVQYEEAKDRLYLDRNRRN